MARSHTRCPYWLERKNGSDPLAFGTEQALDFRPWDGKVADAFPKESTSLGGADPAGGRVGALPKFGLRGAEAAGGGVGALPKASTSLRGVNRRLHIAAARWSTRTLPRGSSCRPARFGVGRAMFHGRLRTESDSYSAPRAAPRVRCPLKSHLFHRCRLEQMACGALLLTERRVESCEVCMVA